MSYKSEMTSEKISENHYLFCLKDETGTGKMDIFEVFPGISLSFNGFKLIKCDNQYPPQNLTFGIEHCREGKIQWETPDGKQAFLGSGSLMPCDYTQSSGHFEFPLRSFQGMTIAFDLKRCRKSLPPQIPVDLDLLKEKVLSSETIDISKDPDAAYILGAVYASKSLGDIQLKLSSLQLIMFLADLEWSLNEAVPLYFTKSQVARINEIAKYMENNLCKSFTLNELSKDFTIPVTALRKGFQGIFGLSPAAYLRKLRMERAKLYLTEGNLTISEISLSLGYDNPSKFSAAFKNSSGLSPILYREQFKNI